MVLNRKRRSSTVPCQYRATSTRLVKIDPIELRQHLDRPPLDPARKTRRIRVLTTDHLVERLVIYVEEDGREQFLHVAKVDRPTHQLVERGTQVKPKRVGVAVNPPARIAVRRTLQTHGTVERHLPPDAVFAPIEMRATVRRLEHRHPREFPQTRFQPSPYPARDQFTRRVLEPGNVVQTRLVQLDMDRRPKFVEMVIVNTNLAPPQILVSVQDHFETMPVHSAALVPRRHVWQTVCRFKDVASPDMRVIRNVEIDAFVQGALNTNIVDIRKLDSPTDPARDVFIRRLRELSIKFVVIKWRDCGREPLPQLVHLATGKARPTVFQRHTDPHEEAVAMEAARAMPLRQESHPPRGLKPDCRCEVEVLCHPGTFSKRRTSGSSTPASANPFARSKQESHFPQGLPAGLGS